MYRHLHKPALRVIRTCACATLPKTTISSASRLTPLLHSRHLATPPPQVVASNLTPSRYNELSDSTMDNMLNALEELLDSEGNPAYEVEYHSGVLTLNLGSHGTYVINKQPPNQQIWLSSPSSGPKRYDYVEKQDNWVYSRDNIPLGQRLNDELSGIFERPVDLQLNAISKHAE